MVDCIREAVTRPQMCAPAALDPSKDPRRAVFAAATPQINACLARGKHVSSEMSLELHIDSAGVVTKALANVGSPEANACIEGVLRALSFPPNLPGVYRVGGKR